MRQTEERYICLLTDFGFNRIFGSKPNKHFVLSNLSLLDKQPKRLQSELFNCLFAEAEIAKFTKEEL